MARKKAEEAKKGAPEWLATYGDMMTLCLCFFVLLFSFSTIDAQKFQALKQSLSGSLGVLESGPTASPIPLVNEYPSSVPTEEEMEEFKGIYEEINEKLKENNLTSSVTLVLNERGLLLRFLDNVLFPSGSAELKPEAKKIIDMVSDIIKQNSKSLRVEGHTDNVPINTGKYPSNWELSTTRAVNVVRYMIEVKGIDPKNLSAVGYGEYHPIDTNETADGRQKNRRVDIIILKVEKVND